MISGAWRWAGRVSLGHVSRRLGLCLMCLPPCPASAAVQWEWTSNIEAFATKYDINMHSPFNRENTIAEIADDQLDMQWRGKIAVKNHAWNATAMPRLGYRGTEINSDKDSESLAYLQEFNLQYQSRNFSMQYGRELLYWGPGIFESPSNPFYGVVDQINPFVEPDARDFFRARYAFDTVWSGGAIANVDLGRDTDIKDYPDFEPIYALTLDYIADSFALGGVFAARDGDSWLGMHGQLTMNDATIVYLDAAVRQGSAALAPVREPSSPVGWKYEQAHGNGTWQTDVLVGGSYTFLNGGVITLEYRRNEEGYDNRRYRDYQQLVMDADTALASDPALIPVAASLLGQSGNVYARTLTRNYANIQYYKRDVIDNMTLSFVVSGNLDDHGTSLTTMVNYYLAKHWRVAGYFIRNMGPADTEYRRYVDRAVFAGVKYFF